MPVNRCARACRPPLSPTTRPAAGSWTGWPAPGWSPRTRSRSSWRTRPSPGPGPGCGPGSTRAWRSSSSSGTSPRRPPAGTRSAGPTASSTAVRGCRAPPSGWPGDDADPTPLEREFLAASQARADDARLATERQIRHERRQNRRLRVLLAGVAALLLVAAGVGALALDRGRDAARDRDLAEQASEAAAHEALVGRSLTLRSTNRSVAALLAVQAFRSRPDHLSQSALLASFTALAGVPRLPVPRGRRPAQRRRDPEHAASRRGRDLQSPRSPQHHHRDPDPPLRRSVASSPGLLCPAGQHGREPGGPAGLHAARPRPVRQTSSRSSDRDGRGCSSLVVHDIATGERLLGPVEVPFSGEDVAISDYGDLVAVTGGYDGDLATYDVATGRRLGRLAGLPRPGGVESCAGHRRRGLRRPGTSTWARWPGPSARSTRGRSRCAGPSRRRGCPPTWVSWSGHAPAINNCSSPPATRPCSPSTSCRAVGAGSRTCAASCSPSRVRSSPSPKGSAGSTAATTSGRSRSATWPRVNRPAFVSTLSSAASVISSAPVPRVRSSWGSPPVRRRTPAGGSTARTWSRGCASTVPRHPSATTPRGPTSSWRAVSGQSRRPATAPGVGLASSRSPPASRRGGPGCGRVRVGRRRACWPTGGRRGGGLLDVESQHIVDVPGPGAGDGERVRRPPGRDCLGDHRGRWSNRRPGARPRDRDRPRAVRRGRPERCTAWPAPRSGRVLVTHESEDGVRDRRRSTGRPAHRWSRGCQARSSRR